MTRSDGYFPYELEPAPSRFGLVRDVDAGPFGELHFVRSERRSGDQVTLFLHGVANDWTTWTPLLTHAEQRRVALGDVILVDLPGFGRSQNTKGSLDSREVGAALLAVVTACGYSSCRLVGHSMGGFLALDMASRGDGRISSVHLVAGAYFSVIETVQSPWLSLVKIQKVAIAYWMQSVLAGLGATGLKLVRLSRRAHILPLALRGFLAHPWRARKSFLVSLANCMRPDSFVLAAQNGVDYDPYQQWSKIKCPIFAVFGAADRLVPPTDMVKLRSIHADAETFLVGDAAHFPHVERPHETLAGLFGVLSGEQ
ncbi:alpha/beta fold hydrolase [Amycolatopsis sp. H20-H5]|uniref:alpha/beta fold hydrolase n=1 Tax=Amycolatopsis sp. H20-H5 TaxID=3046309 RepID=UPI002DB68058|nr:alpha/beta hydrolase [Amycolatopsis sp. H20-H5]MEC3975232.1 alpha/beta hydrolase [Amycolatopsis sp. H20-H5]